MARVNRTAPLPKFDAAPVFETPVPAPCSYHIYVRPRPVSDKLGSGVLVKAKRTKEAELAIATVGQIIAIGSLAWKASTPDLDWKQDPVSQSFKVGDWIHYRQHAGQKLRIRQSHETDSVADVEADKHILCLADSDVLGKFESEALALRFYDWV